MRRWCPRPFIVCLCLAWTLLPLTSIATVRAQAQDLEKAWADFMAAAANHKPALEFPYETCFRRAAAAHDLPVVLLLAVARGESDFNPRAKSHANAQGLMQILWPSTAKHLGIHRLSDLHNPCINVDAGARYLKELLQRYDGNLHLSLAAYNYGPRRIKVGARTIPEGAAWYSGYIYRHLAYVVGSGAGRPGGAPRRYENEQKLEIIVFHRPYRAEAFVTALQQKASKLRLDWFRISLGRFRVVLLYKSDDELARGKRALDRVGFRVD